MIQEDSSDSFLIRETRNTRQRRYRPFNPARFCLRGMSQTLITKYSTGKSEARKCPASDAVQALRCIPERTFRSSRRNSSIYCSNNCYQPPPYPSTFLPACRYVGAAGVKGRATAGREGGRRWKRRILLSAQTRSKVFRPLRVNARSKYEKAPPGACAP
jgi:hypothetical protein